MRNGLIHFNYFPPGSLGGLYIEGDIGGPAETCLFMPSVEAEVTLNVASVGQSRHRFVMPPHLRPVLTMRAEGYGRQWRLMVASKDNHGQNIWAPLSYANVHPHGLVCWGSGNPRPSQFAQAWDLFWSAPFNSDLVPRINSDQLPFDRWLIEVKQVKPSRRVCRLLEKAESLAAYEMPGSAVEASPKVRALADKFEMARSAYTSARSEAARVRAIGEAESMRVGKTWVAANDVDYLSKLEKRKAAEAALTQAEQELQAVTKDYSELFNTLANYCEYTSMVMAAVARDEVQRRDKRTYLSRHYGVAPDSSIVWIRRAIDELGDIYPECQGHGWIRRAAMRRLCLRLAMTMTRDAHRQYTAEYHEYERVGRDRALKEHFLTDRWTKTLAMAPLPDRPLVPFGPCDGVVSIPKGLAPDKMKLPVIAQRFVFRDKDGRGCSVESPASSMALFRRVGDNLAMVFWPKSEDVYLTDGSRLVRCETEEELLAITKILEKPLPDFCPKAWFLKMGYVVVPMSSYDDPSVRRARQAEGRARRSADPDLPIDGVGLPADSHLNARPEITEFINRRMGNAMHPPQRGHFEIFPWEAPWHNGCSLDSAAAHNHCPCGDLPDRESHAWCNSCRRHVCGLRGIELGVVHDTVMAATDTLEDAAPFDEEEDLA